MVKTGLSFPVCLFQFPVKTGFPLPVHGPRPSPHLGETDVSPFTVHVRLPILGRRTCHVFLVHVRLPVPCPSPRSTSVSPVHVRLPIFCHVRLPVPRPSPRSTSVSPFSTFERRPGPKIALAIFGPHWGLRPQTPILLSPCSPCMLPPMPMGHAPPCPPCPWGD